MARIRTIKPEFWTSEQIAELSPTARLLFIGLWSFCDDGGIHPASAKALKMQVFPGDDFTVGQVEGWIKEMLRQGLVIEYEADNRVYWAVTGWSHQKIDKPHFKHPRPNSTTIRRTFDDHQPEEGNSNSNSKGREGSVVVDVVESAGAKNQKALLEAERLTALEADLWKQEEADRAAATFAALTSPGGGALNIAEECARIIEDGGVKEQFARRTRLPVENFPGYVADFQCHAIALKETYWKVREIRAHFLNWSEARIRIQSEPTRTRSINRQNPDYTPIATVYTPPKSSSQPIPMFVP